jgi:hypothetical protein
VCFHDSGLLRTARVRVGFCLIMQAQFMVHKESHGQWPAKNGKSAGESWDFDLLDMSLPAEDSYRGVLPYRLTLEEKEKYWGKCVRKEVLVAVHEIIVTARGPVIRGRIVGTGKA